VLTGSRPRRRSARRRSTITWTPRTLDHRRSRYWKSDASSGRTTISRSTPGNDAEGSDSISSARWRGQMPWVSAGSSRGGFSPSRPGRPSARHHAQISFVGGSLLGASVSGIPSIIPEYTPFVPTQSDDSSTPRRARRRRVCDVARAAVPRPGCGARALGLVFGANPDTAARCPTSLRRRPRARSVDFPAGSRREASRDLEAVPARRPAPGDRLEGPHLLRLSRAVVEEIREQRPHLGAAEREARGLQTAAPRAREHAAQ